MSMKKASEVFPSLNIREDAFPDRHSWDAVMGVLRQIRKMQLEIVGVVNQNSWEFVSATTQPVPPEGQAILWHHSNASGGQPTHYLVVRNGGQSIRFASVETA